MNAKGSAPSILVLSDTHGHLDDRILVHAAAADEIWHAGDVGSLDVVDRLAALGKPVRGVYGNIASVLPWADCGSGLPTSPVRQADCPRRSRLRFEANPLTS